MKTVFKKPIHVQDDVYFFNYKSFSVRINQRYFLFNTNVHCRLGNYLFEKNVYNVCYIICRYNWLILWWKANIKFILNFFQLRIWLESTDTSLVLGLSNLTSKPSLDWWLVSKKANATAIVKNRYQYLRSGKIF